LSPEILYSEGKRLRDVIFMCKMWKGRDTLK